MASQDYNHHPLPAPPSQGQQEQQYSYSSYDQSALPQSSTTTATQQYQPRQQQPPYSQQKQSSYSQSSYPQQQQQQSQKTERQRPRSRGFSFRSDKSQKTDKSGHTGGHAHKLSGAGLQETHAEKAANRLNTKADPTLAMQEAEPSAVARAAVNFDEKPPLSSLQHKDATGAPIAEPDRSNPTRSKWERPLDTIRSFEAAYDGGPSSRQSVYRADSDSVANWNRRNSYYGSKPGRSSRYRDTRTYRMKPDSNGPRFPQESYYGGRSATNLRPDSTMFDPRGSAMMGGARDIYFDGFDSGQGPQNGGNGARNRSSRMQTEPYTSTHPAANRNVYPAPNNHRSYETVASGSGSASYGEPSGYQTDPTSSENSSINRRSPPKRQDPRNDYGISFGQTPGYRPPTLGQPASQPRTMPDNSQAGPPPPPPKGGGTLLRKGSKVSDVPAAQRPEVGDKRKSWFSRRFSKNS
ncbi:hypothetical protein SCUP234_03620 [Seiridium cupressi]